MPEIRPRDLELAAISFSRLVFWALRNKEAVQESREIHKFLAKTVESICEFQRKDYERYNKTTDVDVVESLKEVCEWVKKEDPSRKDIKEKIRQSLHPAVFPDDPKEIEKILNKMVRTKPQIMSGEGESGPVKTASEMAGVLYSFYPKKNQLSKHAFQKYRWGKRKELRRTYAEQLHPWINKNRTDFERWLLSFVPEGLRLY